jgi:hypothetical protein
VNLSERIRQIRGPLHFPPSPLGESLLGEEVPLSVRVWTKESMSLVDGTWHAYRTQRNGTHCGNALPNRMTQMKCYVFVGAANTK